MLAKLQSQRRMETEGEKEKWNMRKKMMQSINLCIRHFQFGQIWSIFFGHTRIYMHSFHSHYTVLMHHLYKPLVNCNARIDEWNETNNNNTSCSFSCSSEVHVIENESEKNG